MSFQGGAIPTIFSIPQFFHFLKILETLLPVQCHIHIWLCLLYVPIRSRSDYLKLQLIGSDNGLWPDQCQPIIWTNAWILLTGPLGTNFSEILIKIYTFSFNKMYLKMSSGKWGQFFLSLYVLRSQWPVTYELNVNVSIPPPPHIHTEISFSNHTRFCIGHGSCAAMAYAKFCSDWTANNGNTVKSNSHRTWITMDKSLLKWVPDYKLATSPCQSDVEPMSSLQCMQPQ